MRARPHLLRFTLFACAATAGSVSLFAAGRSVNAFYAGEVLWVVAQYSTPWAVASLAVVNLAAWGLLAHQAFARSVAGSRLALSALLVTALAWSFGLELGMGIYYQQVTGELQINALAFVRQRLTFPSSADGVCLRASLGDAFTWQLNEQRVHPKLLPLPLDDQKLRDRLLHPGTCARTTSSLR